MFAANSLHKSAIGRRIGTEWDELDTPTPRGSIRLPLPASEPTLDVEQEEVGVERPVKAICKEVGLELDCKNPFPSPPLSLSLISPGNQGERRIMVRLLAGPSLSSSPSSSPSSPPPTAPNEGDEIQPSLVAQPPLLHPRYSLEPEQQHPHPPQPAQPKEPFELVFDSTSDRYILPPSLSPHVSHLRYHLSRASERREAEETLREAKAKVRGEVRTFAGRWRGKSQRKGRGKDKGKDAHVE